MSLKPDVLERFLPPVIYANEIQGLTNETYKNPRETFDSYNEDIIKRAFELLDPNSEFLFYGGNYDSDTVKKVKDLFVTHGEVDYQPGDYDTRDGMRMAIFAFRHPKQREEVTSFIAKTVEHGSSKLRKVLDKQLTKSLKIQAEKLQEILEIDGRKHRPFELDIGYLELLTLINHIGLDIGTNNPNEYTNLDKLGLFVICTSTLQVYLDRHYPTSQYPYNTQLYEIKNGHKPGKLRRRDDQLQLARSIFQANKLDSTDKIGDFIIGLKVASAVLNIGK